MPMIPEKKIEIIPPHLPKEVRQKGRGKFFWRSPLIATLLLAVAFGFFSGLVGGLLINSPILDDWLLGPQGHLTNFTRRIEHSDSRVLARDALSKKAQKSLATFYRQSALLTQNSLPRFEDKIGVGFFVTSDGWLATTAAVIGKYHKKDLVVLTADRQIFQLEKIVSDPISDLVLIKVDGGGFNPLPFTFNDNLEIGLSLWLPTEDEGLKPTELLLNSQFSPKGKSDFYLSSERLYRLGFLKDKFDQAWLGSPVLNIKGEVAGILVGPTSFLRASLVDSALKSVVKSKEIRRAYLGAHFVEVNELIANSQHYGVKLLDDSFHSAPALEKKSPLLALGLKAGDIILTLGNETITPSRSLSDILADYPPGVKVEIKYLRGGEEKTVEAELGETK